MCRGASAGLLALLVVAGCDSNRDAVPEGESGSPMLPAAANAPPPPAEGAARAEERAKAALGVILVDPESARFAEVRSGTAGSVCGLVDSKQGDGKYAGPRPFVVTPEGVAVISAAPRVMFDDPEDVFPDFYIRWCASPAELRTIGPRVALTDRIETDLEVGDIGDLIEVPEAGLPVEPPAPPDSKSAAAPAVAAANPPGRDQDSFSSVVLRKPSEGAKE